MLHHAMLLNHNSTSSFSTHLEIIYAIELLVLLLDNLLSPAMAWITWKAVPLHQNLRYSFIFCFIHCFLLNSTRIPLIWAQYTQNDLNDYANLLVICSFIRYEGFAFYPLLIVAFTLERMVATRFWAWYEKQSTSTIFVIVLIIALTELMAVLIAYQILSNDVVTSNSLKFLSLIASVMVIDGFFSVMALYHYNNSELRKLKKRRDPDFDRYSLSRTYQLRENVVIMKMAMKILIPSFIFASPVFVFYGVAYILPATEQYNFERSIALAAFDLWVALSVLHTQLIFPVVDYRFRRSAENLALLRFFLNICKKSSSQTKFHQNHITLSQVRAGDHYFNWLEKDLA